MHIWPSLTIRDSFKFAYLKKLEWNLERMNSEKKSPTNQRKLLDGEGEADAVDGNDGKEAVVAPRDSNTSTILGVLREIGMVLSCCYCCFCCGACVD
ncbi:hypothetical protein L1049_011457 [Liquidambar formosana]|uniref:Uncharacterized protein n=1 Tax=Liquidambar formosana TaxID=63359 RepID=A0AAP0RRK1_LIQFO